MNDLKELCVQLDAVVLDYFDTLDEIYQRKSQLEAAMKDGLFLMAKARYSLGATRVSTLQVPEDDLGEAHYHVHTANGAHGTVQYELTSPTSDHTVPTVRKRTAATKDVDSPDSQRTPTPDKGLGIVENSNLSQSEHKKPKRDPLNWFGVLVPQALRQSQDRFRRATQHACSLATLQSQLLSLKQRYMELLGKKLAMLADDPALVTQDLAPVEDITADLSLED